MGTIMTSTTMLGRTLSAQCRFGWRYPPDRYGKRPPYSWTWDLGKESVYPDCGVDGGAKNLHSAERRPRVCSLPIWDSYRRPPARGTGELQSHVHARTPMRHQTKEGRGRLGAEPPSPRQTGGILVLARKGRQRNAAPPKGHAPSTARRPEPCKGRTRQPHVAKGPQYGWTGTARAVPHFRSLGNLRVPPGLVSPLPSRCRSNNSADC